MSPTTTSPALWHPPRELIENCAMTRFMRHLNAKYSLQLNTYWELHKWSIENLQAFWMEVLVEGKIRGHFDAGSEKTVLHPADAHMDDFPAWFPGFKLNFAENLLFPAEEVDASSIAISFRSEIPELSADWSWNHLRCEVRRLQATLRAFGVKAGDRIAAYAANCPEVVAFMLAGASLGAIFTAASPDFGPSAVIDRFGQTEPKVLLTCNAVYYNGRVHDHNGKVREVLAACPFIEQVICLQYISDHEPLSNVHDYRSLPSAEAELSFVYLPFTHPLYILYSSGTTGKPKCITHSAGGCLLQHCKEHWLHGSLDASSCFLQYTTIGWMMWQWQVSALQRGTRLVLFDGSPFRPKTDRLLQVIEELGVSHFGTSAKYLTHLQDVSGQGTSDRRDSRDSSGTRDSSDTSGTSVTSVSTTDAASTVATSTSTTNPITNPSTNPILSYSLPSLKTIFSTGSPLPEATFRFLHTWLPSVQVASITGGTDIVSLFAGGCPLLPVHAGEVQCPCLGMAIEARSPANEVVAEGDLVCVQPFPCQPVCFWGDDRNRTKYRTAYFGHFPHLWHHGDFIRFNRESGGLVMLGRSDGTLNPAGVRFGSADLYAICAQFAAEVEDALAVGVKRPGWSDEQVFLFLKLKASNAQQVSEELKSKLVARIRSQLSPRHVPAQIIACPGIPHTLNGKKVEVAVKRILSGHGEVEAGNLSEPGVMEFYRQLGRELAAQESKL